MKDVNAPVGCLILIMIAGMFAYYVVMAVIAAWGWM